MLASALLALALGALSSHGKEADKPTDKDRAKRGPTTRPAVTTPAASKPAATGPATTKPAAGNLIPVKWKLPRPAFRGTPKNLPKTIAVPTEKDLRKIKLPKGAKVVSHGCGVTGSDPNPIIGELPLITDGDKEARVDTFVELGPGIQWVQIDLKKARKIVGVHVWHYHMQGQVYHDVVVQLCDNRDFIERVKTVFNNDADNSAGMGIGEEREYAEMYVGKFIPVSGIKARYIRCYSNGTIGGDVNRYTEVEVFALPLTPPPGPVGVKGLPVK